MTLQGIVISIHAPREGGDFTISTMIVGKFYFNPRPPRGGRLTEIAETYETSGISIHAPREGGDVAECALLCVVQRFQSTPPARGATTVVFVTRR